MTIYHDRLGFFAFFTATRSLTEPPRSYAKGCPWQQQQPLQYDHMPSEVHYVIICGEDDRNKCYLLCEYYNELCVITVFTRSSIQDCFSFLLVLIVLGPQTASCPS